MDRSADNLGQTISNIQRDLEELKSSQGDGSGGGGGGGGGTEYVAGNGINISDDTISVDTSVVATQSDLPTKTSDLTNDGSDGNSAYVEADELADVATSGDYNDLINQPTIPAAQVNSDWNATSGVAEILNKPNLATVATSGSYNDLSNKPTIPTVNNATLTIQKNGTTVQTFTANQSTAATANITVPTKTSDITNDSGFATYSGDNICGQGKNISLSTPANAPLASFRLDGETSQNGTPTPSAPVPVQTVTGENVVEICGKNLFDKDSLEGHYFYNATTYQPNAQNLDWDCSQPIPVESNTTYAISMALKSGENFSNAQIIFWDANKKGVGSAWGDIRVPRTTGANVRFITIAYKNTTWENVQLELGSTATAYEPYQGQSYTISLGSIELCKIGTYQDSIYKSGGKWYKHKAVGKVTLDGVNKSFSNRFTTASSHYRFIYEDQSIPNYTSGTVAQIYCNRLIGGTIGNTYNRIECIAYNDANHRLISYISSIEDSTLTAANTWLQSNPLDIVYILATATEEELTNATLISQLNALLTTARTFAGINNIFTITPNEQGTLEMCFEGGIASPTLMAGCSATTNGLPGLVPAPAAGDQEKYLRGDGTWQPAGSSSDIPDGAVTTPKLASKAVTTAKINDGAVTNTQIANSTIAAGKIDWSTFKYTVTGTTDGNGFLEVPPSVVNKSNGFILTARYPGTGYAFVFVFSDSSNNNNRYTIRVMNWDLSPIGNASVTVEILYCLE